MTRLDASLVRDLPTRIGVGGGTALFVDGTCATDAGRIRELAVVANGAQHPVIAHGMPAPGNRGRAGDYWWALVTLPPHRCSETLVLGLHATISGGREASAKLGEVELTSGALADVGHGNGEAVPSGGNGRAKWRPKGGPLIAIAMATHDPPPELFRRQIESIREQTHENWVCVISDDASDPDGVQAMRQILGEDPRFRLYPSPERLGVYRNFERALELAPREAEFLALCDQDDRWHPEKLATLREAMGPEDVLAYSDMRIVKPDGELISDTYWTRRRNNHANYASLLIANTITGAAALFRRTVLDYALPFPQELDEQRHDHWIAIVAMALGGIGYVPRALYDYVQHGDAALGHAAANLGAPSSLGRRVETIKRRNVLAQWRTIYFQQYVRLLLATRVVELRCRDQLGRDKRKARAVSRALSSDSARGAAWLSLRSIRARFGASETMERDRALLRAIAWLRISRLRARFGRRRRSPAEVSSADRTEMLPGARAPRGRPLAVEVRNVSKSFRVPLQANPTLANRLTRLGQPHGYRRLPVLKDISFDIAQGEFFGIVGRNGSGKSTLLKLLASIYRADSGNIRVGGQVAPIIELGIGFHPELPARDNVIVNGVMMGLTAKEAAARFDKVMAFAGLEGFETMKLKNYSSGMKVRLAFAIMVEADGDVMMIDEVLAVGDSGFQRKSREIFRRYKEQGKTVILVSHQMTSISELCDRAMLLEGGRIDRIGDPEDATRRYSELAVAGALTREQRAGAAKRPELARIADLWLGDLQGDTSPVVDPGEEIRLHAVIEATRDVEDPCFRFEIRNQNRARIFSPESAPLNGDRGRLAAGERVHVHAAIENKLTPGGYILSCAVNRRGEGREIAVSDVSSIEFAVPGIQLRGRGLLSLDHDVRTEPLDKGDTADHEGGRAS
jgi:ABC-type polysaccharide/polyol phosphate transport system ATPase subunit/glycosyltransferase involved in cell wall biosynthesis